MRCGTEYQYDIYVVSYTAYTTIQKFKCLNGSMSEKGKIWKQLLGWKQNFNEMYESFINIFFCNMFVCTHCFFFTQVYTKLFSYVSWMRPSETRSTCMDPVVLCCYYSNEISSLFYLHQHTSCTLLHSHLSVFLSVFVCHFLQMQ